MSSNLNFVCLLLPDLSLIFPTKHDPRPNQNTVTLHLLSKINMNLGFNYYRHLFCTLKWQFIALNTVGGNMVKKNRLTHQLLVLSELPSMQWVYNFSYSANLSYNHSNISAIWEYGNIIPNLVCQQTWHHLLYHDSHMPCISSFEMPYESASKI